jgi:hypothetical protein
VNIGLLTGGECVNGLIGLLLKFIDALKGLLQQAFKGTGFRPANLIP